MRTASRREKYNFVPILNPNHAQYFWQFWHAPVPSRKTPPAPPLLAVTGERAPGGNEKH